MNLEVDGTKKVILVEDSQGLSLVTENKQVNLALSGTTEKGPKGDQGLSGVVSVTAPITNSGTINNAILGFESLSRSDITTTDSNAIFVKSITTDSYGRITGIASASIQKATTSVQGVASFDSGDFSVSSGAVSIKSGGIDNNQLASSSISIGTTSISLGGSSTTLSGLTSVSSTSFTGALIGNASTATKFTNPVTINNVSFDGSSNITIIAPPYYPRFTFSDSNYTITATTSCVVSQTGTLSAPRTITLPLASSLTAGSEIIIQAGAGCSATNTLSIAKSGSNTINGSSSLSVIAAPYAWRRLITDGSSNWTYDNGVLRASNNLSDLTDINAARTNLLINNVDNTSDATKFSSATGGYASTTNPLVNGTVAIGTSTKYAREDHVHPTDTSRQAASVNLTTPADQATPSIRAIATGNGTALTAAASDHTHNTISNNLSLDGYLITNLGTPINPNDAARKTDVDSATAGLNVKTGAKVATNGTETYTINSGSGKVTSLYGDPTNPKIDGITLTTNDRLLIKDAPAASGAGSANSSQPANGIYYVISVSGNIINVDRASDATTWSTPTSTAIKGAYIFISQGTQANNGFIFNGAATGTIGTTAILFTQFSSATNIQAGNGISTSGTGTVTVSVKVPVTSPTISVDATGVDVLLKSTGGLNGSNHSDATNGLFIKQDTTTNATLGSGLTVGANGIRVDNSAVPYLAQSNVFTNKVSINAGNTTGKYLDIYGIPTGGNIALQVGQSGQAYSTLAIKGTGSLTWSDGTTSGDTPSTNLYRSAVSTLRTDGNFNVAGTTTITGSTSHFNFVDITKTGIQQNALRIFDGSSYQRFRIQNDGKLSWNSGSDSTIGDTTLYRDAASTLRIGGSLIVDNTLTANTVIKSGGLSSQFLKADGSVESDSTYLKNNQPIQLTGDVTSSATSPVGGQTTISTTLKTITGLTPNTYNNSSTAITPITIDASGRITATGNAVTITPSWTNITATPTTVADYGITDAAKVTTTVTTNDTLVNTITRSSLTQVGTLTSLATSGDVTVGGDLNVTGAINEVTVDNLNIKDKTINAASGATSSALSDGAGLIIGNYASNPSIIWNNSTQRWTFNKDITANLFGNASTVTNGVYTTNFGTNVLNALSYALGTTNAVLTDSSSATLTYKTFNAASNGNVLQIAGTSLTGTTGVTSNTVVLANQPSITLPTFGSNGVYFTNAFPNQLTTTTLQPSASGAAIINLPATAGTLATINNNNNFSFSQTISQSTTSATLSVQNSNASTSPTLIIGNGISTNALSVDSAGKITAGTWNGANVAVSYGGTGVGTGAYNTTNSAVLINSSTSAGASTPPTWRTLVKADISGTSAVFTDQANTINQSTTTASLSVQSTGTGTPNAFIVGDGTTTNNFAVTKGGAVTASSLTINGATSTGTLTATGGIKLPTTYSTSTAIDLSSDTATYTLYANPTNTATITLPTPNSSSNGRIINIKNGSVYQITVSAGGGSTSVEGGLNYIMPASAQYQTMTFQCVQTGASTYMWAIL